MANNYEHFVNFNFSDDAILLLRGGYCYRKIKFSDIQSLTLKKGRAVNNYLILLILSLGLLFLPANQVYRIYTGMEVYGGMYTLGSLFIAGLTGAYMLQQAIKTAYVLEVKGRGIAHTCRFHPQVKLQDLDYIVFFLKEKCRHCFKVEHQELVRHA